MNLTGILDKINITNGFDHLNVLNMINHPLPILVYLLIAFAVTRIPFVRVYFSVFNTLLHEIIRIIIDGGITNKIKLHKDGPGRDENNENSRFKNTMIIYAGYTGASLAAIGLFYLVSNQNYHIILYLFIGLLAVSILLWIRNFGGILWAISFLVLLALPLYFRQDLAIMHISIFLSSLILIQSIINGIQVCRRSLFERNPDRSGILSRVKVIPAMMLGIVLFGQSLYAGYFIIQNILSLY